jgi:hypothetical protein
MKWRKDWPVPIAAALLILGAAFRATSTEGKLGLFHAMIVLASVMVGAWLVSGKDDDDDRRK